MHDTNWNRERWKQEIDEVLAAYEFRQRIEVLDDELAEAFANWQHWSKKLIRFNRRPRWQRWLLGGYLTATILAFIEQSAEGIYWSIELQYH